MSKVLTPQKAMVLSSQSAQPSSNKKSNSHSTNSPSDDSEDAASPPSVDYDDFTTTSSILEFLTKEQECCSEADAETIFQEVSRLADNTDTRSVDEILREAELLIQQQSLLVGGGVTRRTTGAKKGNSTARKEITSTGAKSAVALGSARFTALPQQNIKMNAKYTRRIENVLRTPLPMAKMQNGHCRPTSTSPSSSSSSSSSASSPHTPTQLAAHPQHPATARTTTSPQSTAGEAAGAFTPVSALATPTPQTPSSSMGGNPFAAFVDNLPSESVISEESTPKDMNNFTLATTTTTAHMGDDAEENEEDGTDTTMEELTEGIETIELLGVGAGGEDGHDDQVCDQDRDGEQQQTASREGVGGGASGNAIAARAVKQRQVASVAAATAAAAAADLSSHLGSPTSRRYALNFNATLECSPTPTTSSGDGERRYSGSGRRASMTPDSGIISGQNSNQSASTPRPFSPPVPALRGHLNGPLMLPGVFAGPPANVRKKSYCDKSTNSSPKQMISSVTSPIEPGGIMAATTREHTLKLDIEKLQERLMDTEERLQSLRLQHDTLSQLHRDMRENSVHLQDESEMLKLDVQHLNECANMLRAELQAARADRNEALDLQRSLQADLDENKQERKRGQEVHEKDARTIQDLQRQCREMERILLRKHPDSVSALIVASKNPGRCLSNNDQENMNSRRLLEQRIAQLEADAKEQDKKAQQILANVQARFNSVQSKYETHIADLETQVLSLQEINTKLNEKIESQVRTIDYFVGKKADKYYNNCTQTDDGTTCWPAGSSDAGPMRPSHTRARMTASTSTQHVFTQSTATAGVQTASSATRDHGTNTIGGSATTNGGSGGGGGGGQLSAGSSTSSTANSTPNTSRPGSKQSGLRKPIASAMGSLSTALASRLPVSQSDSTISQHHASAAAKEDAHLLATIRGMRVDLAIKEKAMQRLTRELDECKKTMRKLQREKDALKSGSGGACLAARPRGYDAATGGIGEPGMSTSLSSSTALAAAAAAAHHNDSHALREAQSKIKLLEADYKTLHDKRIQDLKTLQTAHERELASCHETVRILQQRLSERDSESGTQKRRKVPVDYYALKAKVTSLERRHTEREERLHLLVEALSKGRLNGALDDLMGDNQ